MPFKDDLARAQHWEYLAAKCLCFERGYFIRLTRGRTHDIEYQVHKTVEVKADFMSEQTGNIYIETFNSKQGVKSGLDASSADMWCYCIPHMKALFLFDRVAMLAYIDENIADLRQVWGGDENSSGYLLPITELERLDFVSKIVM
jgi:hypothetical protein